MARAGVVSWRSALLRALLVLLNIGSTALTLFTGLQENPLLVALTGRYDGLRQRLTDGSINYEIAATELFRAHKLTPLEEIGERYRFITAPRRDPSSIGEYRSVCTNLNSNSAPVMALMYDDFWGKGARRVQVFVYSISAPQCQVVNVRPAWHDECIASHGSAAACHAWALANFEALQQDRQVQVGVVRDFGERGVPLLRCLARPDAPFEFQADLLAHQRYWSGATSHVMIQTSECRAVPLAHDASHRYGLFEAQATDEGADVVIALPPPGWFTSLVTDAYNVVTLAMIARGLALALLHNRAVPYLPYGVRYSRERRALQYLVPFMPAAIYGTENKRLVVTFKGAMLVASDVWMNHWLYMYLSILDALANVRLTYITLQVGTWMLAMKLTVESFLFICAAIMKITWIMCLVQTLLRVLLKFGVRVLRAVRLMSASTRVRLEWDIDGLSMFLSYKLYGALLCLILAVLVLVRGAPSFMVRADPYKVGAYGGLPRITRFWQSEIVCDLLTLLATLAACGQCVGALFLCSKYKCVADNSILRLLQRRYGISGWDGLLAAGVLGLDPDDPACLDKAGRAHARFSLGALLQLLYLSGPSSFVHLAGDYIFHHGGFARPPVEFKYPVSLAAEIGLLESSRRGSLLSRGEGGSSVTRGSMARVRPVLRRLSTTTNITTRLVMAMAKQKADMPRPEAATVSIFERSVRVVSDGYLGKVLLVDVGNPGLLTTNPESGLYEFVVTDALASVPVVEIQHLLGTAKKLRSD